MTLKKKCTEHYSLAITMLLLCALISIQSCARNPRLEINGITNEQIYRPDNSHICFSDRFFEQTFNIAVDNVK